MKRLAFVTALVAALSAAPVLSAPLAPDICGPIQKQPCIQAGTFNIEWLGSKMRKGKPKRTQEEVEKYDKNPAPGYKRMIEAFKAGRTWLDVNPEQ